MRKTELAVIARYETNIYTDMANWNKQLKCELAKDNKGFEALAKYAKNWKV
jgi:hypothetical protein